MEPECRAGGAGFSNPLASASLIWRAGAFQRREMVSQVRFQPFAVRPLKGPPRLVTVPIPPKFVARIVGTVLVLLLTGRTAYLNFARVLRLT